MGVRKTHYVLYGYEVPHGTCEDAYIEQYKEDRRSSSTSEAEESPQYDGELEEVWSIRDELYNERHGGNAGVGNACYVSDVRSDRYEYVGILRETVSPPGEWFDHFEVPEQTADDIAALMDFVEELDILDEIPNEDPSTYVFTHHV